MKTPPALKTEDKVWAAVAHGSAFLFFVGFVVAIVVWFTQRKNSTYARFQALQAMIYQLFTVWLWLILMPVTMIAFFAAMALSPIRNGDIADNPASFIGMEFGLFAVIFGLLGLIMLGGITGAVACLMGRDFRYPILGSWLRRYLQDPGDGSAISETKEDQVVAAVCHGTTPSMLMGLAGPLIVWITQKDRSVFLRFQALQATVYQVLGALSYVVGFGCIFLAMFASMGLMFAADPSNNPAAAGIVGGSMLILTMCSFAAFYLGIPLYLIMAAVGSIRSLRGHNFHYPLLGRYIERRLQPPVAPEMI